MHEPVLPLRDIVVFPQMIVPLFVGRNKSVKALEIAMSDNKDIVLVTQKVAKVEDPKPKDLYSIGTICKILQLLKLPDGTLKVLVEGKKRVKIDFIPETKDVNYLTCNFKILPNLGSSKVDITGTKFSQIKNLPDTWKISSEVTAKELRKQLPRYFGPSYEHHRGSKLVQEIEKLGPDDELHAWIQQQFDAPLDATALARNADSPQASVIVTDWPATAASRSPSMVTRNRPRA